MTDHAATADRDVVVVGAGVLGLCTALALQREDLSVALLDRLDVFEGTTGAGGGFIGPWSVLSPKLGERSPMAPAERYALNFYRDLAEAGNDIGFHQNGLLWLAGDEQSRAVLDSMAWSAADPTAHPVDAQQAAELAHGLLSPTGHDGGYFVNAAAHLQIERLGQVLLDQFLAAGGSFHPYSPVEELLTTGTDVRGVRCADGRQFRADRTVLAAGAWTNELLAGLGVYLPAVPQITSRIVTEPVGVSDEAPLLFVIGAAPGEPGGGTPLWIRPQDGGLLWGGMYTCEPRNALVGVEDLPARLDELSMDGVEENFRVGQIASFLPLLSRRPSYRVRHGAPCYTPDEVSMVGRVRGHEGLMVVAGCNETGVTHGPAFGRFIADLVFERPTELDAEALDPTRFGTQFADDVEAFVAVQAATDELMAKELM